MKLYEVPRNTRVRVLGDAEEEQRIPPGAPTIHSGEVLNFGHVDGMYSFCTNDRGEVVHLVAWAEVEIVGDA